jgi:hypothetical protein
MPDHPDKSTTNGNRRERPWGQRAPEAPKSPPWWAVRVMRRAGPVHGHMFRHATMNDAVREARWLAAQSPGSKFVVLEAISEHLVTQAQAALANRAANFRARVVDEISRITGEDGEQIAPADCRDAFDHDDDPSPERYAQACLGARAATSEMAAIAEARGTAAGGEAVG